MNKEEKRAYYKAYYEANKEKLNTYAKTYYEANKEKAKASYKTYYEANKEKIKANYKAYKEVNKEKIKANYKAYKETNKEKLNAQRRAYFRNKRKTDELYALSSRLRTRTYIAFKLGGYSKGTKTEETLGCDWVTLKHHIEIKFTEGMSWENPSSFHIDHIKPLSNAKTKEDLIKRCHYTNLQPLPPEINIMKSNLTPMEWELKQKKINKLNKS
jgi:hypothetical protein